jgi:DNA-binding transcriptional MerR regulator
MSFYSIGEVAKMVGIPTSTLRFYDREGLFLHVKRSSGGIRVFSDVEVETLKVIECLKSTGMQIKDIKLFLDWCLEGDKTLQKRRDLFYERKEIVEKQLEDLQKTMEIVKYKIWYYETAVEAGSEELPKNMPVDELPEDVKKWKMAFNK